MFDGVTDDEPVFFVACRGHHSDIGGLYFSLDCLFTFHRIQLRILHNKKKNIFFFVFFFHIHSINHNPTSLNVFVYVYLVDLFTRSFHLFISLVHFTYSYVYSSILLVHFTRTLHLLTSFVHFTCSFHSSISLAHYSRPFHYFTLSISPGITPGSMPPNSRSLHEEGATFISFFIVRNGEFKEKGNIYIFTFIQFISKYWLH